MEQILDIVERENYVYNEKFMDGRCKEKTLSEYRRCTGRTMIFENREKGMEQRDGTMVGR